VRVNAQFPGSRKLQGSGIAAQPYKKVCMVTPRREVLMLILIEMFSASVGVVQSLYKSPSLAGGSSVVGVRDAVDACIIPVGDQHVEESAGDTRTVIRSMAKPRMRFARWMSTRRYCGCTG
jgi:hypothetical protein